MKMNDWIKKLDDFLRISEKELLTHSGNISHKEAIAKARKEYNKYRMEEDKQYISDFDRTMNKLLKDKGKENL
jgi:hypothetical protein